MEHPVAGTMDEKEKDISQLSAVFGKGFHRFGGAVFRHGGAVSAAAVGGYPQRYQLCGGDLLSGRVPDGAADGRVSVQHPYRRHRRAVRGLCVYRAVLGDQLHAGGLSTDVYRHDVHLGGHRYADQPRQAGRDPEA